MTTTYTINGEAVTKKKYNASRTNSLVKVNGNVANFSTALTKAQQATKAAAETAQANLAESGPERKFTTKILSYPLNVDDPAGSGHYIIFRINEQSKAKLKAQKAKTSMKQFESMLAAEMKILDDDLGDYDEYTKEHIAARIKKVRTDLQAKLGIKDFKKTKELAESTTKNTGAQGSIALQNPTTSRIGTAIALYMPPSINASYAANYEQAPIGAASEAAAAAIKSAMGGDYRNMGKSVVEGAESLIRTAATTALDTVAPGAAALIALERGRVITPRMELMFQSMGRRAFSYEFNFIPKSSAESIIVEKIVKEFKKQMAADFMGGGIVGVREMSIPSTFDIEYMYKTAQNTHLNKIGTCVLDSLDVSYGGDKFVAYAGGVPQSTKISLKFTEMEIMTRSRVMEGY